MSFNKNSNKEQATAINCSQKNQHVNIRNTFILKIYKGDL